MILRRCRACRIYLTRDCGRVTSWRTTSDTTFKIAGLEVALVQGVVSTTKELVEE